MSELTEIITAAGAVLGTLGVAARFVWNKIEVRFLDIEKKLQECQQRELDAHDRRANLLTVIEMLWSEITRMAPTAAFPPRAKQLLDQLKGDAPPPV